MAEGKHKAGVQQLWRALRGGDPDGEWQTQDRLWNGGKRVIPTNRTHDIWSEVRRVSIKCMVFNKPPNYSTIQSAAFDADFAGMGLGTTSIQRVVAFRTGTSSRWLIACCARIPSGRRACTLIMDYYEWFAEIMEKQDG